MPGSRGTGVEFRVFGTVEVYDDNGVPVDLGGPRQRTVLARLLVAGGRLVPRDTLIEDVYDGEAPPSAVSTLQSYVSHLRRAIEPGRGRGRQSQVLVGRPAGYQLTAAWVDAARFAELVDAAEFLPPARALESVQEALKLWRGTPYGEFSDAPWALAEVNRLSELRLVAVERRAQALLDLGRAQAAVTDLEVETAANPYRERLWHLRALALYRTGRQADALALLRQVARLLSDELGLEPGPELRALEGEILRQAESQERVAVRLLPAAVCPTGLWGRDRELAELGALADAGEVTVAAVSGEPGIGKTRLLEALADRCGELGRLVLWGRCHDGRGTPSLWPWRQALGELAPHCAPVDREALAGLLDDETPAGPADEALWRRSHAVARWLADAARARPLVVLLDDLQWADPASLELLRDVVALVRGMAAGVPLSLVTAFREGHPGRGAEPIEDMLAGAAGYHLARVRLSGVDAEAVRAIAKELEADIGEPEMDRLTDRTGGNPFFVRESVRLLTQGGGLDDVPGAVAELVRRRVAALGPEAAEALRVAAVVGREFDPAVVSEVCRAPVYEALDRAVRAGLVTAGEGRRSLTHAFTHSFAHAFTHSFTHAFTHDMVRETLVADLPPLRKAVVHRDVMTALSARPSTDVSVIAHHAIAAGPAAYEQAATWAVAAAEQAGRRLAYREAASWWEEAVRAHGATASDPGRHVDLLLRQVGALLEAGDLIGARRVRAEALRVADRAADRAADRPELAARALTALDAPALWTLRDPCEAAGPRLARRFETALRELPGEDVPMRARLLAGLAQELYDGSGDPRCDLLSAEAVETARTLGDSHLLMRMLNARYLSLPQPQRGPEMERIAEELRHLAATVRAPAFELLAQMMHTHNRLESFDIAAADRAAARCEELLERLSPPWPRLQHTLWQANRLSLDGRFDAAEAVYGEADRQAEQIGMWHARRIVATARLTVGYTSDTMGSAGPLIDMVSDMHPSFVHCARILHLLARGRHEEAYRLVAEGWPAPPSDASWGPIRCLQAAATAAVGDLDACRAAHADLLPYSGRIAVGYGIAGLGPVDWYLYLLASALDDPGMAARHLRTLERLAERNGLRWWRDRARAVLRTLSPLAHARPVLAAG
ncbi:BTAD domain-containing putative transcriptional regulator [Microbispora sp. NPDC046933]|uniref:BTAD domain-containing putative transcriptional regulator n=1 Tax=Microbispora sp. NPDC046933 TaxID=3155618 RepID=UPI0033C59FB8